MKQGGKIYGEGYKGQTMDIACDINDSVTFCNKLRILDIKKIKLVNFETEYTVKNIDNYIQSMYHNKLHIVKIFKKVNSWIRWVFDNTKKNFNNEMRGMKRIYNIFGSEKYSTIRFLNFEGFKYIGIKIYYNNNQCIYAVLNQKCSQTVDKLKFTKNSLNKFIKTTLKLVDLMQKNKYIHTDLKPDNIIYCKSDKAFKIIDWEMSRSLRWNNNHKFYANMVCNSPVTYYLHNKSFNKSFRLFSKYNKDLLQIPEFASIFAKYKKDMFDIIKHKKKSTIFNKFKYHFEVFALGIVYMKLLIKNNINPEYYLDFLTNLISLDNLWTAHDAFNHFCKLICK